LIEGHFERSTAILGQGGPSQTDLLAVCNSPSGKVVIGVEGKVDEDFQPLVRDWDDGTPNRHVRLAGLLDKLGIARNDADDLRYQLLHRTAAVLIEAPTFGADCAVMLVHSFDPGHAKFDDFVRFADRLGTQCEEPDQLSNWKDFGGIGLCIGWCADRPMPE